MYRCIKYGESLDALHGSRLRHRGPDHQYCLWLLGQPQGWPWEPKSFKASLFQSMWQITKWDIAKGLTCAPEISLTCAPSEQNVTHLRIFIIYQSGSSHCTFIIVRCGVGWGGTITFVFLCTHRHRNLSIFLAVLQTQAVLFHDQIPVGVGWGGWDNNVLLLSCRHRRDGHARATQRMPIQKKSRNEWLRWTFFNYWRGWWWWWWWWSPRS